MTDIRKFLTLSTAHVTKEVGEILDDHTNDTANTPDDVWQYWVICSPWSYGWWIYAQQEEGLDDMPECLRACLTLAKQHDCAWLLFDCDGEEVDGLPTYEW